jgi:hypothetical protein
MPVPAAREARTAASRSAESFGSKARPLLVPFWRALAMPAEMRSWIMERSNSANKPSIWKSALPAGVLVSTPGRSRYRSTPAPCSSPRNPTRS